MIHCNLVASLGVIINCFIINYAAMVILQLGIHVMLIQYACLCALL